MAQVTDRTVGSNPTGFDMRTELNNIISALETDNSGSSEPLNTVAYMKWLDTSNATYYYYKERNHDNTAWVTLFRYTVDTKIMEVVSNGVVLQDSTLVHKTGNETIEGVKTFSSSPIVPNATTATQAIAYGQAVKNTGNETIAGVKTFSSFPITPSSAPTNDYQVANKKYVIDNAGISLATANSYDLGVGQTWQDVTASRAAGITYTNTTGKPIVVNVISSASANNNTNIIIDGIALGYNSFTATTGNSSNRNIVPNGSTYSVSISGASLSKWYELR